MALLRLKSITKSFGAIHALNGVDVEIRPGQIVALVVWCGEEDPAEGLARGRRIVGHLREHEPTLRRQATALLELASSALGSRAVRKMIGMWLLTAVNVCASSRPLCPGKSMSRSRQVQASW